MKGIMTEELDNFFGNSTFYTGCPVCGKTPEIQLRAIGVEIKDGKAKGRHRSVSKSFCVEHGTIIYNEMIGLINRWIEGG